MPSKLRNFQMLLTEMHRSPKRKPLRPGAGVSLVSSGFAHFNGAFTNFLEFLFSNSFFFASGCIGRPNRFLLLFEGIVVVFLKVWCFWNWRVLRQVTSFITRKWHWLPALCNHSLSCARSKVSLIRLARQLPGVTKPHSVIWLRGIFKYQMNSGLLGTWLRHASRAVWSWF